MRGLLTRIRRRLRPGALASCAEVARVLQPYLDGEVDDETLRRVSLHLEDCRDCGLEAATYVELRQSLRERGAPPPEVLERLRDFADRLTEGSIEPGNPADS